MAVIRKNANDEENSPDKVGTHYTVRNPHPDYGTDPNIKNEYGHTEYPKWVDHPTKKQVHRTTTYIGREQSTTNIINTDIPEQVWVNNAEEEKALLAGEKAPKAKGWG